MVIRKIGEFYYDSTVSGIILLLDSTKTNKEKMFFIELEIDAYKKAQHNITASRVLTTLCMMYNAVKNNEIITLED